jgi:hypothetical protein
MRASYRHLWSFQTVVLIESVMSFLCLRARVHYRCYCFLLLCVTTLQEKQELLLESYVWSSNSIVHSILLQAKVTAATSTATASTVHNNNNSSGTSGNSSSSDSNSSTAASATRAVTRRSAAKAAVIGDGVSDLDVTNQWPQLAATLAMCEEQVQQLDVLENSNSSSSSSSNSNVQLLAVQALLAKVLSVAAERVAQLCLGQLKLSFEFADQVTRLLQSLELSVTAYG